MAKAKDMAKVTSRRGRAWDPAALSQRQLASLLGVSGPAITKWGKRGCPRNADRSYDLAAVVGWIRTGAVDVSRLPQSEVLRIMGVSKPTLADWANRGCPRNADRSYDLAAVVAWRTAELDERAKSARKSSALEGARVRKTAADAELAEMTLAQRRGDLLPRVAVVSGWIARYKAMQAQLMGMIGRLGTRGVADEHIAIIREEVDQVLLHLAAGQVALQLTPTESAAIAAMLGVGPSAAGDAEPTGESA